MSRISFTFSDRTYESIGPVCNGEKLQKPKKPEKVVNLEIDNVESMHIAEIVHHFEQFLKSSGYVIYGNIRVVNPGFESQQEKYFGTMWKEPDTITTVSVSEPTPQNGKWRL